jgi:hypothetical protein
MGNISALLQEEEKKYSAYAGATGIGVLMA